MHTSYFMRGTIKHPDLGAYSSLLLPKKNKMLPAKRQDWWEQFWARRWIPGVQIRCTSDWQSRRAGLQHSTLPKHVSESRFLRRLERVRQMNKSFARKYNNKGVRAYSGMYDDAVKLMKSEDLKAFDLSRASPMRLESNTAMISSLKACCWPGGWSSTTFAMSRLTTAVGTRTSITSAGVSEKSQILDRAMGALLSDLTDRGMLDDTLVVLATEFGRTPDIVAGRNGRNHYPKAFTCLLAGGGIHGGQTYGKTDAEGREVEEDQVSVPDFNATIAYALGLPLKREIFSPSRRPFKVADEGSPITSIFG